MTKVERYQELKSLLRYIESDSSWSVYVDPGRMRRFYRDRRSHERPSLAKGSDLRSRISSVDFGEAVRTQVLSRLRSEVCSAAKAAADEAQEILTLVKETG